MIQISAFNFFIIFPYSLALFRSILPTSSPSLQWGQASSCRGPWWSTSFLRNLRAAAHSIAKCTDQQTFYISVCCRQIDPHLLRLVFCPHLESPHCYSSILQPADQKSLIFRAALFCRHCQEDQRSGPGPIVEFGFAKHPTTEPESIPLEGQGHYLASDRVVTALT